MKKTYYAILGVLVVVFFISGINSRVSAFSTGSQWHSDVIVYNIGPNTAYDLGLTYSAFQSAVISSVNTWNRASSVLLANDGTLINYFTTSTFSPSPPCGPPDVITAAVACVFASETQINNIVTYLNSSGRYTWNTSYNNSNLNRDVQSTVTHELGHWLQLRDNPPGYPSAVMTTSGNRVLTSDDKAGATQLYGIFTGFELTNSIPLNRVSYQKNTVNIANVTGTLPEVLVKPFESGVPMISGSYYLRLTGHARVSSDSYAYMVLFHDESDPQRSSNNYVKIVPGMRLVWDQYNAQQTNMSVDFVMTDETSLSGTLLTDQFGVSVNPINRGNYSTGMWRNFVIDLTPLAGKTIRRWRVMYDNRGRNVNGPFRSYFENVRLTYP